MISIREFPDHWSSSDRRSLLALFRNNSGLGETPQKYGAVGDDTTDDTAAINKAIEVAAAQQFGGFVLLPPGRYRTSGIKTRSRVTLMGCGEASLLKLANGVNGPVVSLLNDQVKHTTLRDFWIDGNRSGVSGANCNGITYDNVEELTGVGVYPDIGDPQHRIYNVVVTKCLHFGMSLFVRATHIDHCLITHCGNSAIWLRGSDNFLTNTDMNWLDNKGVITTGGGQLIAGCKVWYNGQSASFAAADAYDIDSSGNLLVGCGAQDTSRHGLRWGANGNIAAGMVFDGIGMQFPERGVGFEHDDGTGSHVAAVALTEAATSRTICTGTVRNRHFPSQTLDHAAYLGGATQVHNYVELTILDTDPREEMYVITNPNGGNVVRINNREPVEASVTAANLAAVANAINTTNKYRGKMVWESDNNRLYMATGTAAADPWYLIADNTGAVTPA